MTTALLVASRNRKKLAELRRVLDAAGVSGLALVSLDDVAPFDETPETGTTFEENALAKARYFFVRSGLPALSDDSGLVVDALGGAPGVRSKRWSDRPELSGAALDAANNAHLLSALEGAPSRAARYVCAAAWVDGSGEWVARGETSGRILEAAEGAGGFGYDPFFFSDDLAESFGRVSREEKARVSHRARAVQALLRIIDAGS